jgi:hypothetical protein
MEPLFFSIIGAPSSGKSYFLTALTWLLRRVLPQHFFVDFTDADPAANGVLGSCEESLFLNPEPGRFVPLGDLIRKTELEGELYDTVAFGEQTISFPRPFMFTMQLKPGHPNYGRSSNLARVLCLYDNAGEHFQPGQDTTASPVTRHLARSRSIFFLFDPMQDHRFREFRRLETRSAAQGRVGRQEILLNEAAARLRKHGDFPQNSKYERPLIIVLSKFDEWGHLLDGMEGGDPWRSKSRSDSTLCGIELDRIEQRSQRLRQMLLLYCPELVSAAEAFAEEVTYIPVSSLGDEVALDAQTGRAGIRPEQIRPYWVTVPLVYALSRTLPGLIPRIGRKPRTA